jgi:hypothetical protein
MRTRVFFSGGDRFGVREARFFAGECHVHGFFAAKNPLKSKKTARGSFSLPGKASRESRDTFPHWE